MQIPANQAKRIKRLVGMKSTTGPHLHFGDDDDPLCFSCQVLPRHEHSLCVAERGPNLVRGKWNGLYQMVERMPSALHPHEHATMP